MTHHSEPAEAVALLTIDALAQEIRRVDGNHSLGAGALAEAILPYIARAIAALATPAPAASGTCQTCKGHGMIGGWSGGVASIDGGGGYVDEPCPDCTPSASGGIQELASASVRPEPRAVETSAYGIIDPDYARVFSIARCIAWSEGYALMMHGSFTRDLDLLVVPWAASACEPEHVVNRIAEACGLTHPHRPPSEKPHGRLAFTLMFKGFGDPRFVDLSVMPRRTDAHG